jgi:tetratricopeptide (TPR) repeat protein/DNA-binding transcriptional ArsR family regulator
MGDKKDILEAISDRLNLSILSLLSISPTYVRKLAESLGMWETHVSSRLRRLEELGLVQGRWERVEGRNVRVYYPKFNRLEITLTPTGYLVRSDATRAPSMYRYSVHLTPAPKATFFVGRQGELEFLRMAQRAVVWGPPGIGKTALVSKALEGRRVVWHDVTPSDDLRFLASKVAASLGGEKVGKLDRALRSGLRDPEVASLLAEEVKDGGITLVLDNYHLCMDGKVEEALLSISEMGGSFVVISRELPLRFASRDVPVVELRGLRGGELGEFLRGKGIEPREEVIAAAEELGGNPSALNVLSEALSSGRPLEEAKALASSHLAGEVSEVLSAEELKVLKALSFFRTPVPLGTLPRAVGGRGVRSILRRLIALGLVRETDGLYGVPAHLASALLGEVEPEEERELHRRAGKYYLGIRDPTSLLEALYHMAKARERETVISILRDPSWVTFAGLGEKLLGLLWDLKDWDLDRRERAVLRYAEGVSFLSLGSYEEARRAFEEAAEEASGTNDVDLEVVSRLGVTDCLSYLGKYREGVEKLISAMRLCEAAGAHRKAQCLYQLSSIYAELGRTKRALQLAEESLRSTQGVDDLLRRRTLLLSASLRQVLNDYDEAMRRYSEVLSSSRNAFIVAHCRWGMGWVMVNKGRPEEGLKHFDQAVEVFRSLLLQAYWLYVNSEGTVLKLRLGEVEEASNGVNRIRELLEKVESPTPRGVAQRAIGIYEFEVREDQRAGLRLMEESERSLRKGYKHEMAHTLWCHGLLLARSGEREESLRKLRRAFASYVRLGDRDRSGEVRRSMEAVEEGRLDQIYPGWARPYL